MTSEPLQGQSQWITGAVNELADLIRRHYPEATFQIVPAEDDASIVHLVARVDVDDTEDVADLVMDRMIQMQIDEGLPIYVIPLRTAERIAALRQAMTSRHFATG
jgi:hypothetical protein